MFGKINLTKNASDYTLYAAAILQLISHQINRYSNINELISIVIIFQLSHHPTK